MAIETDTFLTRISLASENNLEKSIKDECEIQSARDQGRRLVAAFTTHNQLILIFQRAADNNS